VINVKWLLLKSQIGSLTIHKRPQTVEKFTQSNNLTNNKRVHTGENPNHCDTCQKKFGDISNFSIRPNGIHT